MEEKPPILQVATKSEEFGLDGGLLGGPYTPPPTYAPQLWRLPHSGIPDLLINYNLVTGRLP